MDDEKVNKDLKKKIWFRDEFTCKSCGKTLSWDDMQIGYPRDSKGECKSDEMIALCRECVREGKTGPVCEEEEKYVLSLIRQLFKQVMWEDRKETKDEIISDLKDKISDLREENEKIRNQMEERGRIAISYKKKFEGERSDFKRFRDRIDSEIVRKASERTKELTIGIIESLDNLDRAIREISGRKSTKDNKNALKGIESIRKGLMKTLEEAGVESIEPENERFDPNLHEAVETVNIEDVNENTVVELHLPGYSLNGTLLRPAKVSVSQGGPPWPSEEKYEEELEEFEELEVDMEDEVSLPDKIPLGSGEEEELLIVKTKGAKK